MKLMTENSLKDVQIDSPQVGIFALTFLGSLCDSRSLKAHLVVFDIFLWFYLGGGRIRIAGIEFMLHTTWPLWLPMIWIYEIK